MDEKEYGERLGDVAYWFPHIKKIFVALFDPEMNNIEIKSTFPGTYPTFIINGKYVIKLFINGFYGAKKVFRKEVKILKDLLERVEFVPKVIYSGSFEENNHFLIMNKVGGVCYREYFQNKQPKDTQEELEAIVKNLYKRVSVLHAIKITSTKTRYEEQGGYNDFIQGQMQKCVENQKKWKVLNPVAIEMIPKYLTKFKPSSSSLCLCHCDLTEDHVFVDEKSLAVSVIDFGDARENFSPSYELVALFFGFCYGKKAVFRKFLKNYPKNHRFHLHYYKKGFAYEMMCLTLLHEFNVMERHKEEIKGFKSIDAVSDYFFAMEKF